MWASVSRYILGLSPASPNLPLCDQACQVSPLGLSRTQPDFMQVGNYWMRTNLSVKSWTALNACDQACHAAYLGSRHLRQTIIIGLYLRQRNLTQACLTPKRHKRPPNQPNQNAEPSKVQVQLPPSRQISRSLAPVEPGKLTRHRLPGVRVQFPQAVEPVELLILAPQSPPAEEVD